MKAAPGFDNRGYRGPLSLGFAQFFNLFYQSRVEREKVPRARANIANRKNELRSLWLG
jgi:hypothetical protein